MWRTTTATTAMEKTLSARQATTKTTTATNKCFPYLHISHKASAQQFDIFWIEMVCMHTPGTTSRQCNTGPEQNENGDNRTTSRLFVIIPFDSWWSSATITVTGQWLHQSNLLISIEYEIFFESFAQCADEYTRSVHLSFGHLAALVHVVAIVFCVWFYGLQSIYLLV